MKITRYFIAQEDEEMGGRGWLPLWIPKAAGFNTFSIVGCMHDILEHRLCDQGHFHEEVMAFGRMAVLRGLNDVHSGRGMVYTVPESMGLELSGIWLRADMPECLTAPKTVPTDPYFECYLEELMHHYAKGGMEESQHYSQYHPTGGLFDQAHLDSVTGWLRIGFLDGVRRYGSPDHEAMDIANTAWSWAKENKHLDQLAEEYTDVVLRVTVDTTECRVRHNIVMPDDEYGMHQPWLRSRIWDWRNNPVKRVNTALSEGLF
jgi:hypothetical protein